MSKRSTIYLTLAMLLVVAIPLGIWLVFANRSPRQGKYDQLAQCLTVQGVKMYGTYWCSHCQNQKKTFGSSWQYVTFIECSLPGNKGQTEVCLQAGIKGYPTWEFSDGQKIEGELKLQELATKTNCALE